MSIQELPVQEQPVQELPVQEPHWAPGTDSPGQKAHADARDAEGLSVWPRSARPEPHGDVRVGGCLPHRGRRPLRHPPLRPRRGEVRERCRTYRTAFPDADIVYAAKAFLCRAMAHWVQEEGLGLDVCSAGELALAVTTGFPPEKIVLHGNAKSPEDLQHRPRLGVGRIVVDSTSEIARLAALVPPGTRQHVMVRVVPGIAAGGHTKIRTGTDDQKFGLSLTDGSAQHAVTRILDQPHLELVGLHCHIGSQVTTVKPYVAAVRRMIGLLARIRDQHGITLPELNIGGGHAIAYRPGEEALNMDRARRPGPRRTRRRLRPRPPCPYPASPSNPAAPSPARAGIAALPRPGRQTHRRPTPSSQSTAA